MTAPLCVLLLSALPALAGAGPLEEGRTQYAAQNFEEALVALREAYAERKGPPAARLLGLTYYHLLRYEEARPLLEEALPAYSSDSELIYALTEALLTLGQADAALRQLEQLQRIVPEAPRTYALAGQVYLVLGRQDEALAAWQRAVDLDPVASAPIAADLARLYARQGMNKQARQVAQRTIDAAPDTLEADQLRSTFQQLQEPKALTVHLGYRLEHDSNVVLEPDDTPVVRPGDKGKSDTRNVLFADLLGRYGFAPQWDLFAEAHLYGSIYNRLEAYDQTRQNYLLGLGWSAQSFGFRAPYEFTRVNLDGDSYLTARTVTPGAYVRLGDITLHGFYRYQDNDYEEEVRSAEQRSGTEKGPGALLLWPFLSDRGLLRVLLATAQVDADGDNWKRDEHSLLAEISYRWSPRLNTSLGFQFTKQNFDKVHDVFLVRRRDDGREWFATLDYQLYKNWALNVQAARVNWDSNINIYEYPRTVVAVGLSVHF